MYQENEEKNKETGNQGLPARFIETENGASTNVDE